MSRLISIYGGATAFKGLAALTGFGLSVMLTRMVGATTAGYYFLFFSVVSVLSVVCRIGGDNYLLRVIPNLYASGPEEKMLECTKYAMFVSFAISSLISICMIIFEDTLLVFLTNGGGTSSFIIYAAFALPFYSIVITCSFFLLAVGKPKMSIGLPGVALPLVMILLLWIVFRHGEIPDPNFYRDRVSAVLAIYCLSVLIIALFSVTFVVRYFARTKQTRWLNTTLTAGIIRNGFSASIPFFVVAVLGVLSINIGNLTAGYFLEAKEIAFLAVSTKIAASIALILTGVNAVAAPRFSKLYRAGEFKLLHRVFKETQLVTFVVGLIPFLLILMFSKDILSIFGIEFERAANVLIIVAFGQFFNSATGPVTYLLQMTGHEQIFMFVTMIYSIVAVAATIILTARFGIIGTAAAGSVSIVLMNITSLILATKRLGISWK